MEITSKVAESNATPGMIDLGGLGQIEEVPEADAWPEPMKFPWFGVEVRVHPMLSDTVLIDMLEAAGELDSKDPKAAIVVKTFVRDCIHPDDFEDFWRLGKANGYGTEKFAEVAARVIEAVTGDPTQESSDSSNGPLPTATKSLVVSSKLTRTIAELEEEGRPDLAEFYLLASEAGVGR